MNTQKDLEEIEILKIQNEIQNLLHSNNGVTVHFRYTGVELCLITFNSTNKEFFLLKSFENNNEATELQLHIRMLRYVKELLDCAHKNEKSKDIGNSYTVTWQKQGDVQQVSYFYGHNIEDVLQKFYFGKGGLKHLFNVFEIKLNPIS